MSIVLALLGFGAWAIVWGVLAGELLGSTLAIVLVRFRPRFVLDGQVVPSLVRFGANIVALKVIEALAVDGDYLVVGHLLGPVQLGFYSVAYRVPEMLLSSLFWIFSTIAFPVYARARTLGAVAFSRTMLRALRLITLFSFPAGVVLALIARDVVLLALAWRCPRSATPPGTSSPP